MKLHGWLLGESLAEDILAVNSTSPTFWPSRSIFLWFAPKYVEHMFQRMTIPTRMRNCLQLYRNKNYLEMVGKWKHYRKNTALECRLGVQEQTSESFSKNILLSAFHVHPDWRANAKIPASRICSFNPWWKQICSHFQSLTFFTSGYRGLSFEVFGLLTKLLFCIGRDVDFFLCSKD